MYWQTHETNATAMQLYDKLAAWAEDEFRSVNGQIEYLLSESVKKRYGEKPPKEKTRADSE